jgi:hypothetical protein
MQIQVKNLTKQLLHIWAEANRAWAFRQHQQPLLALEFEIIGADQK